MRSLATEFTSQFRAQPGAPDAEQSGRRLSISTGHPVRFWLLIAALVISVVAGLDGVVRLAHAQIAVSDGVRHLKTIQAMVPQGDKADYGAVLSADALATMRTELTAAHSDFGGARGDLSQGAFFIPSGTIASSRSAAALVSAADEACIAGLDLVDAGQSALGILKGGFFTPDSASATPSPGVQPKATATATLGAPPPALTEERIASLKAKFDDAVTHLNRAVTFATQADLSAIPSSILKPQQQLQVRQLIANWPSIRDQLATVDAWLTSAPILLGVKAPQKYLLQLMDRSELRATGGFIGNYAVMTLTGGKVAPFQLNDIYLLDVPYVQQHGGLPVPDGYRWWPIGDFGLRDSNLSADFPTSAQLGINLLQKESGVSAQGVVAITPPAIARMIDVVGNIEVPEFKQTVTSKNLEQLIHYYQQTKAYDPVTNLPSADQLSSPRKRFTALLGKAFMAKLRGLTPGQLVQLMKSAITSLHAKDIQIYLGDKDAQALLGKSTLDASIYHGSGDSLTLTDMNLGFNKGSQFTTVSLSDTVALDAEGAAHHTLAVVYKFDVTDMSTLFGPPVYRTFTRLYFPDQSDLTRLEGFAPGLARALNSDYPGRLMRGGWIIVPNNSTATLRVEWEVPHAAVKDASGRWRYTLRVQHQAGSNQSLTMTIQTPESKNAASYNGPLATDKVFNVGY